MKCKTLFSILVFALLTPIYSLSQNSIKDVQLWAGFNYKLKLNKKFKLDINPEIRFADTIRHVNSTFLDIGLTYKLSKRIDIGTNYRFSYKPAKNNKDRFNLDLIYSWDKKDFPLAFDYRLRFQYGRNRGSGSSESFLRNKFTLDYNLCKLVDPYAFFELFFKFGKNEFRNTRLGLGLDWKINKRIHAKTFYIYEREIYVNTPQINRIIGLGIVLKGKLPERTSSSSLD